MSSFTNLFHFDISDKIKSFADHYKSRDKDVTLLLWGDSITARDAHTTYYTPGEIAHRPPLCDSKNLCGLLWDKLNWKNADYRRFDAIDDGNAVFTEAGGAFETADTYNYSPQNNMWNLNWDDIYARNDVTRYTTGSGSKQIAFTIKQNVRICNFIYRAGASCAASVRIAAPAANKLQVFDEAKQAWVEAHNFTFSMTDTKNIYQKRLKLRCYDGGSFDSRNEDKKIIIEKPDGVPGYFNYWGIEYSDDPCIFTIINSARGSHDIERLEAYMQEDLYGRNPDLVLFQIPIMNMGVSYGGLNGPLSIVSRINNIIYNTSNTNSLIARWGNFNTHNVVCWLPHFSVDYLGLDEATGTWKKWIPSGNPDSGPVDVRDYYNAFNRYFEAHKDMPFLNLFDKAVIDGMNINQNLYEAFKGSGVTGKTFTNDGTHQNDTGTKILTKYLFSIFDF